MSLKRLFLSLAVVLLLAFEINAKDDKTEITILNGKFKVKAEVASLEELESFVEQNYPDFIIKEKKELVRGQVYELEPKIEFTIKEDEKVMVIKTKAGTVSDILNSAGIELKPDDLVFPNLNEKPTDAKITLFKAKEKLVDKEEAKPFDTIYQESKDPALKENKVIQQGVNGVKKITKKEKYVNNVLKGSVVVKEEVVKEAIPMIIETPMKSLVNEVTFSSDEFLSRSMTRKLVMTATAYEAGPRSTGKRPGDRGYGITASGTRARRGSVAVDTKIIPFGTKLYIKSLDAEIPDYGYAIAEDTGGAIKGMKIDLFMNTVAECFQFGRRKVEVYILPADTPDELFK